MESELAQIIAFFVSLLLGFSLFCFCQLRLQRERERERLQYWGIGAAAVLAIGGFLYMPASGQTDSKDEDKDDRDYYPHKEGSTAPTKHRHLHVMQISYTQSSLTPYVDPPKGKTGNQSFGDFVDDVVLGCCVPKPMRLVWFDHYWWSVDNHRLAAYKYQWTSGKFGVLAEGIHWIEVPATEEFFNKKSHTNPTHTINTKTKAEWPIRDCIVQDLAGSFCASSVGFLNGDTRYVNGKGDIISVGNVCSQSPSLLCQHGIIVNGMKTSTIRFCFDICLIFDLMGFEIPGHFHERVHRDIQFIKNNEMKFSRIDGCDCMLTDLL